MANYLDFSRGWLQRAARHQYQPSELVDAVDVIPDAQGAIQSRLGHSFLNTVTQSDVHSLYASYTAEGNLVRYQGAGTQLYRHFLTILTGLNGQPWTAVSMRGFGEDKVYNFFANGDEALRVKDDGGTLSRWGIAAPASPVIAAATAIPGNLRGTYAWKQVFVRKPLIALRWGRWTEATQSYTLTNVGSIFVSTGTNNDGIVIAGVAPFAEVLLYTSSTATAGVYDYSYWNGAAWVAFTPDDLPNFMIAGTSRLRWSFPGGNWAAISGEHLIRIRATTAPGTAALISSFRGYDSVFSAVGNPSPTMPTPVHLTLRWGRWTDATASYVLGTPGPITVSTPTVNDGVVFAGSPTRFDDIRLTITQAQVPLNAGVYEWAYWNGAAWVVFLPSALPNFNATGEDRVAWSTLPAGWTAVAGEYLIRVRATTLPATFQAVITPTSALGSSSWLLTLSNAGVPGVDYDPQVTHSAIYRTKGDDQAFTSGAPLDSALYYFEHDVPIEQTSFFSSLADDALGAELLVTDNNRPPAFTTIADHQNRLWGAVGNNLYFSKDGHPEAFPGQNYLAVSVPGDDIRRIKQYDANLYVWTWARVFQILGTDELSYVPRQIQCPTGLGGINTVDQGAKGIFFLGSDGNLWLLQGVTAAVNISEETHYQFTHMLPLHGVAPLNQLARETCVGVWAFGRYYLSYPAFPFVVPNASLFLDEGSGTWWRDSRGWRAMHYDKTANLLYGSNQSGGIFVLETSLTDNGAAFQSIVQTADSDEDAPTSDKELVQVIVDTDTGGRLLTVEATANYGTVTPVVLGYVTSGGRGQHILSTPVPHALRAKAWGYRLTGVAPITVYRLFPTTKTYPVSTKTWITLDNSVGYPGPKILESLLLDVDLRSGYVQGNVWADGAQVVAFGITQLGHHVHQIVTQPHEGTIFQVSLEGSGEYTLYESSTVGWRPLPPPVYNTTIVMSDMGTPQQKTGLGYFLDVALLGAGTLTTTFVVDNAVKHHIDFTGVGRQRTERYRLPATVVGRLFELRLHSTVPYQLWPGTVFNWQLTGTSQEQEFRLVKQQYGELMQTPLSQLP